VSQTPSPNQTSYSSSDCVNYFIMDFALCARDIVLLEQKKTPQKDCNKGFWNVTGLSSLELMEYAHGFNILLILSFYNMSFCSSSK